MTQKQALDILKLGYNVFLTGTAGSGKTFVLNQYIEYLKKKNISYAVTASTGIAATQLSGITINSWSGVGIKKELTDSEIEMIFRRLPIRERILTTQVLIIDEISMLPLYTFETVDKLLRYARKSSLPFGGIQIVLCGDFLQLPPVDNTGHAVQFVFKSRVWHDLNLKVSYLQREYRQNDEALVSILREIRANSITQHSIKTLASRIQKDIPSHANITKLFSHSVNVDAINTRELAALAGKRFTYEMKSSGNEFLASVLKRTTLVIENLILAENAFVMFVKNNFEEGYVNGTLGTVVAFDKKGMPIIETMKGKIVTPQVEEWSIEDGTNRARVKQLPLRLAWAMTVHKSQGMSLDAAVIDLSRPFLPGMGYVALSRVRSLDGIQLLGLNKRALEVSPDILRFDKKLKRESFLNSCEFENTQWVKKQSMQMEFVRKTKLARRRNGFGFWQQLPLPSV